MSKSRKAKRGLKPQLGCKYAGRCRQAMRLTGASREGTNARWVWPADDTEVVGAPSEADCIAFRWRRTTAHGHRPLGQGRGIGVRQRCHSEHHGGGGSGARQVRGWLGFTRQPASCFCWHWIWPRQGRAHKRRPGVRGTIRRSSRVPGRLRAAGASRAGLCLRCVARAMCVLARLRPIAVAQVDAKATSAHVTGEDDEAGMRVGPGPHRRPRRRGSPAMGRAGYP